MNADDIASGNAGVGGEEDEGGGGDGGGAGESVSHPLNFSLNICESLALSLDEDVRAANSTVGENPDPTVHDHNLRSGTQTRPSSTLSQGLDTFRQFATAPPLPDSQPSNADEVIDYECALCGFANPDRDQWVQCTVDSCESWTHTQCAGFVSRREAEASTTFKCVSCRGRPPSRIPRLPSVVSTSSPFLRRPRSPVRHPPPPANGRARKLKRPVRTSSSASQPPPPPPPQPQPPPPVQPSSSPSNDVLSPAASRRVMTPAPKVKRRENKFYSFRSGSRASTFTLPPANTKPASQPSRSSAAKSDQPLASRISRRVVPSASASAEPASSPRFRSNARGAKSMDQRRVLRSHSQNQELPLAPAVSQQLAECNSPDDVSDTTPPSSSSSTAPVAATGSAAPAPGPSSAASAPAPDNSTAAAGASSSRAAKRGKSNGKSKNTSPSTFTPAYPAASNNAPSASTVQLNLPRAARLQSASPIQTNPPTSSSGGDHSYSQTTTSSIHAATSATSSPSDPLPSMLESTTRRCPTIAHVPKKSRTGFSKSFCSILEAINADPSVPNVESLLAFAKSTLAAPARNNQVHGKEFAKLIDDRLAKWDNGDRGSLWKDVCSSQQPSRRRNSKAPPKDSSPDHTHRLAIKAAQDGQYKKAAKILSSHGIATPSAAVKSALELHPVKDPPIIPDEPPPPASSFSEDDVRKAVSSFPEGTAPGPSGFRASYLKQAINCPSGSQADRTLRALTACVNNAAAGKLPLEAASFFCGASLHAANKKTPGTYRPIAVGEVLRRLVAKCLAFKLSPQASTFLQPRQVGVKTRGGTEAVIHSVQAILNNPAIPANSKWVVQIDFKNAFNTIDRSTFLAEVRKCLPGLSAFVEWCYGANSRLVFGEDIIYSSTGVQQGDPLGPLLFAICLHLLIRRI